MTTIDYSHIIIIIAGSHPSKKYYVYPDLLIAKCDYFRDKDEWIPADNIINMSNVDTLETDMLMDVVNGHYPAIDPENIMLAVDVAYKYGIPTFKTKCDAYIASLFSATNLRTQTQLMIALLIKLSSYGVNIRVYYPFIYKHYIPFVFNSAEPQVPSFIMVDLIKEYAPVMIAKPSKLQQIRKTLFPKWRLPAHLCEAKLRTIVDDWCQFQKNPDITDLLVKLVDYSATNVPLSIPLLDIICTNIANRFEIKEADPKTLKHIYDVLWNQAKISFAENQKDEHRFELVSPKSLVRFTNALSDALGLDKISPKTAKLSSNVFVDDTGSDEELVAVNITDSGGDNNDSRPSVANGDSNDNGNAENK